MPLTTAVLTKTRDRLVNNENEAHDAQTVFETRSQAVARIADRTAKNYRGHVT